MSRHFLKLIALNILFFSLLSGCSLKKITDFYPTKPADDSLNQTEKNIEVSQDEVDLCVIDDDCVVVKYKHCCGSTKRAINKKHLHAYNTHPEWQKFDNPGACTAIEICPDDSSANKAICRDYGNNKKCEVVLE